MKMKHYLYECTDLGSESEGVQFIVGAYNREDARRIAIGNFKRVRFICKLSDYEAEISGLDEY